MSITKKGTWRFIWNVAGKVAQEIEFRSIRLQQVSGELDDPKIVKRLKNSSKMLRYMSAFFLSITGIYLTMVGFFSSTANAFGLTIYLGVLFVYAFFLILFFGIMSTVVLLSEDVFSPLVILPLSPREQRIIGILSYARIYETIFFVALILLPIFSLIGTTNIFAAIMLFLSMFVVTSLALSGSLFLGKLYLKGIYSEKSSTIRMLSRFLFTLFWGFLTFGIFGMGMFFTNMIGLFALGALNLPTPLQYFLTAAFPFSFGYLFTTLFVLPYAPKIDLFFAIALGSSVIYTIIAVLGMRWLYKSILFLSSESEGSSYLTDEILKKKMGTEELKLTITKNKWIGFLKKDLKLVFRHPSSAIIIIYPFIIFLFYLLQLYFDSNSSFTSTTLINLIVQMAVIYPMFSFALLVREGKGIRYLFTLPVDAKIVVQTKSIFLTTMYMFYALINSVIIAMLGKKIGLSVTLTLITVIELILLILLEYSASYLIMAYSLSNILKKGYSAFVLSQQIVFILYSILIVVVIIFIPSTVTLIALITNAHNAQRLFVAVTISLLSYAAIAVLSYFASNMIFLKNI